jgi:hypothetical protein
MSDNTYNGWSNYETWNVALWIDSEEKLNRLAVRFMSTPRPREPYWEFTEFAKLAETTTADGVDWRGENLDYEELDEMMQRYTK